MSSSNPLTLELYDRSGNLVAGAAKALQYFSGLAFSKGYPGGLYLDCGFFVNQPVKDIWALKGGQRLVVRCGKKIAWEGELDDLTGTYEAESQGMGITATGMWGTRMMRRSLNKPWADKQLTDDVWILSPSTTGAAKFTVDRNNRIRFLPKGVAFLTNDYAIVKYTAPAGQTVKRITGNYDMAEGAQNWSLGILNHAGTIIYTITITTGTGTFDHTLATPDNIVSFYWLAGANQTPVEDGTYYGQVSDVVVYTETGSINLTEVVKDVRDASGDISTDDSLIGSNTLALVPFITDGWKTLADIVDDARGYGDSSQNQWAVGLRSSELAVTPDGDPVIFCEQFPDLTDYDFIVRVDDDNLVAPFSMVKNYDDIWNYIIVDYTDELGNSKLVTPIDDATLKDQTSIDDYGQRDYPLSVGHATVTTATAWGKRFLKAKKDYTWRIDGSIQVTGYLTAKSGVKIPASLVDAGKRLRVMDYQIRPEPIILRIASTDYDHDSQTVTLNIGEPDGIFLPTQFEVEIPYADVGPGDVGAGGGGSGSASGRLNWKKHPNVMKYAKKHGIDLNKVTSFAEKQKIIKAARRG